MLGMWSPLLLWGLVTPCQGLLETVGTLARIDKDELGKGEPKVVQNSSPSASLRQAGITNATCRQAVCVSCGGWARGGGGGKCTRTLAPCHRGEGGCTLGTGEGLVCVR